MRWLIKLTLVCLISLASNASRGQDSLGISLVSSTFDYWLGGNSIIAIDDRIFVGNGPGGIRELSVQGDQVSVINRFKTVRPDYIARIGNCIAAVNYGELSIIDPDDPGQILSRIQLRGYSYERFLVKGDFLFMLYMNIFFEHYFYIVECSDLEHPTVVDTLRFPDASIEWFDIDGDNLFVAYEPEDQNEIRLAAYDISNPAQPRQLADNLLQGTHFGPFALQDTLLAIWTSRDNEGLEILDVSDPANPERLGSLDLQWEFSRIWIEGSNLFGLSSYYRLTRVDISDPASPRVTGNSPNMDEMREFLLYGDFILMTTQSFDPNRRLSGGLIAFRSAEDDLPFIMSLYPVGWCGRLVEAGGYDILCGGMMMPYEFDQGRTISTSLKMINFDDPARLRVERSLMLVGPFMNNYNRPMEGVAVGNSIVYYANRFNQGLCLQIEGANRLRQIGEFHSANDVALLDTLLYAAVEREIYVYGVSNPATPRLLTRIDPGINIISQTILYQNCLVVGGDGGIRFYDLTDPAQPEPVGEILSGRGGVAFQDELMFNIFYGREQIYIEISDASDPENIRQISLTDIERGGRCYISGEHLFIGGSWRGLTVFDVSDPESPRETGHYLSDEVFNSLIIRGNYLVASHETHVSTYNIAAAIGVGVPPEFVDPPVELFCSETDTVRFDLHAIDMNGDSLIITMLDRDLPELGAIFTDHGNGRADFFWPTNYEHAGRYQSRFSVSDGITEDSCLITIMIENINRLPESPLLQAPPDNSPIPEDSIVTFGWSRSRDADGDDLDYLLRIDGFEDYFYYNTGNDTFRHQPRSDLIYLLGDSLRVITWQVSVSDGYDTVTCDSTFTLLPPLKAGDGDLAPVAFSLFPPYPNPFNSSVTITFSVGARHAVPLRLAVYDLSGRLVADLLSEHPPLTPPASGGGKYSVVWDAGCHSAGVYLVRLEEEGKSVTRKVVLMR